MYSSNGTPDEKQLLIEQAIREAAARCERMRRTQLVIVEFVPPGIVRVYQASRAETRK